ncbi:MAG TPA: GTP-binding protein, partial [Clostridia bacterium]|nr:GTP-binding protein [Clostridia bacterium]
MAIIGRPNVGKSTLFNRIVQQRKAIVDKTPGVTRDRVYAESEWAGFPFSVVDTAGLPGWDEPPYSGRNGDPTLEELVREQVMVAVSEADLILFVVDGKEGLVFQEKEMANALRKGKKPVLLVVNKVDNPDRAAELSAPFFELGLGAPVCISAEHGLNVGDLLDEVKRILAERQGASDALPGTRACDEDENRSDGLLREGDGTPVPPRDRGGIRVAIVGKPNVGKSSLFNAIVGENRALVHSEPGTTRDVVDASLKIG